MTVLRTEIERALDELISNEEGMRFQGLAVVLAKLKWPDLIATERKKDLGLDAHAPAVLAQGATGRGLACSLTATLEKIKSDIEKVSRQAPDVRVLLFATPRQVTTQMSTKWATAIREAHGIELVVMPREDIITDLMLPANASICRSHLRIPVPVEAALGEVVVKVRAAVSDVIRTWATQPRLAGRPRIALSMKLDSDDTKPEATLSLADLHAMLSGGRRVVLQAPAGQGKTTTLVQLSEGHHDEGALAFLVDMPVWLASGVGILEFIAGTPAFLSRDISAQALARLQGAVQCVFLINGWNEVADAYSVHAVQALRDLERSLPTAGVIVATRTHRIQPPLPGSVRVTLLSVTRQQRRKYLEEALGSAPGNALRVELEGDRVLEALTRTPLILSEVTTIFRAGGRIPKTKARVLGQVVQLFEQGEEHRDHLERPPLSGHARDYLAALADDMTSHGGVGVEETQARALVHVVTLGLTTTGQIARPPEPAEILSALCAHHVLERVEYPSVLFRFQHQQFQEFSSLITLQRELWSLLRDGAPERDELFTHEYVNRPIWEEPLRMLAEEIGELSVDAATSSGAVAAGMRLIRLALFLDPVFAADLSRLSGPRVWGGVRNAVGDRLRAWYRNPDEHNRQCSLAGMLASGSEDFSDILLPLLTSDDQQVRLRTYRAWGEFHLSSLGDDWKPVVERWGEGQRADFVSEVGQRGRMPDVAEELARADPKARVRAAALEALDWVGATGSVTRALTESDDQAFEEVLRSHVLETVPADVRPRALETYRKLAASTQDPIERLRFRLSAIGLGAAELSDGLKADLESWPAERADSARERLLRSALDAVQRTDPAWVSHWVVSRIIDGSLYSDRWVTLISGVPEALKEELFAKLSAEDVSHTDNSRALAVLAAIADLDLVGRAVAALRTLRSEIPSATGAGGQRRGTIARQLHDLIRALSPNLAIAGTLRALSATPTAVEYEIVTELFGRANGDDLDLKEHLQEDVRQQLRRFLTSGLSLVLRQDDFSGELKANAALALARTGVPEDMADLESLISADIERVHRGMDARIRGTRSDAANGASMRWSNWYVRAVVWLDPARAENVLLALLSEPDYESDAAAALVRLARTQTGDRPFGREMRDYSAIWSLRAGVRATSYDESRRLRYTEAIKQQISVVSEARSLSDKDDSFNGRLKSLATRVALLDGRDSTDYVMEILALPGEWDGWTRVDALEALLRSGARPSAVGAFRVLNPAIEKASRQGFHDQQARYLLQRCLSVLPFVEPCSAGVGRTREVVALTRLAPYELRDAIEALGHSRCTEAFDVLRDLAIAAGDAFQSIAAEWIEAIATLGTGEAKRTLLSFVDPDMPQTGLEQRLEYHDRERLASAIAEIAESDSGVRGRLYSLCARQLPGAGRLLLAEVVARLGTVEALMAGLNLIRDDARPMVPYELIRGIENVFLNRRPYEGSAHAYTLEPQAANEIRRQLFAMVLNDSDRRHSAWTLLGQSEWWRVEYGRPGGEPRHPALDYGKPWPPIDAGATWIG